MSSVVHLNVPNSAPEAKQSKTCWKLIPPFARLVRALVGIAKRITFGTSEMAAVAANAFRHTLSLFRPSASISPRMSVWWSSDSMTQLYPGYRSC